MEALNHYRNDHCSTPAGYALNRVEHLLLKFANLWMMMKGWFVITASDKTFLGSFGEQIHGCSHIKHVMSLQL
jgi:hypothetical protein